VTYLERGLTALIVVYWQLPAPLGRRVLRVLLTSPAQRVVELRHHLAVLGTPFANAQGTCMVDVDAYFERVATPTAMMRILDDLRATGALSLADVCEVEEAILACTSAEGRWIAR